MNLLSRWNLERVFRLLAFIVSLMFLFHLCPWWCHIHGCLLTSTFKHICINTYGWWFVGRVAAPLSSYIPAVGSEKCSWELGYLLYLHVATLWMIIKTQCIQNCVFVLAEASQGSCFLCFTIQWILCPDLIVSCQHFKAPWQFYWLKVMATFGESSEMPKCPLINIGIGQSSGSAWALATATAPAPVNGQFISVADFSFLCFPTFPAFPRRTIRRRGLFWPELKTVELLEHFELLAYWHSSTKNGKSCRRSKGESTK